MELAVQLFPRIAQPNAIVQAKVVARGFRDIASAQFTLDWDPRVLRFVRIAPAGASGAGEGNWGIADAGRGTLAFSWNASEGEGLTLSDGTELFCLQFQVVGQIGEQSRVAFSDAIAPREVASEACVVGLKTTDNELRIGDMPVLVAADTMLSDGVLKVSIRSEAGRRHVIEYSDSLSGGQWAELRRR